MNAHRLLHISLRVLVIFAFILLAVGGVATLITVVWHLDQFPSNQAANRADRWVVVDDFHTAVNSNNVNDVVALFADSATINDNKYFINGRDEIRNWILHSDRMAGLHLRMFHTKTDGETIIWLDEAKNELEGQSRYYILQWEAVTVDGKIQSLVIKPRYMPDLK